MSSRKGEEHVEMHDKQGWNCQAKNPTKGIKVKKIWEKE